MNGARQLRMLMQASEMIVAPGAYDCIGARLIEQAGFEAVYMTGSGTAASMLGYPDFGMITMTEMATNAGNIAQTTSLPVIADADTGFGDELSVIRTVREYEMRGVAGLHIEDQVSPKRCGHLEGKEVVERDEFIAKVRAAVAARRNTAFLIIARTDSRSILGFDDAIGRANAALEAGADMAFVEAMQSMEELEAIPRLVKGPCLFNVTRGGKTPDIDMIAIGALGYRMTILPSLLIAATMESCDNVLKTLRETHLPQSNATGPTIQQHFDRFGASAWDSLRAQFRQGQST
jgi:2-methylisocitrate lyase-like PEP mutase family enzyme